MTVGALIGERASRGAAPLTENACFRGRAIVVVVALSRLCSLAPGETIGRIRSAAGRAYITDTTRTAWFAGIWKTAGDALARVKFAHPV